MQEYSYCKIVEPPWSICLIQSTKFWRIRSRLWLNKRYQKTGREASLEKKLNEIINLAQFSNGSVSTFRSSIQSWPHANPAPAQPSYTALHSLFLSPSLIPIQMGSKACRVVCPLVVWLSIRAGESLVVEKGNLVEG